MITQADTLAYYKVGIQDTNYSGHFTSWSRCSAYSVTRWRLESYLVCFEKLNRRRETVQPDREGSFSTSVSV